ncbi:MAG: hypothetical protein V3V37_08325 [Candidatus Adiutricales bacterium]
MSFEGTWNLKLSTPMGEQTPTLILASDGSELSGTMESPAGKVEFTGGSVEGNTASWNVKLPAMGTEISVDCTATVDGDKISGELKSPMGSMNFSGERA